MSSKTESAEAADRSFVVVASRLPVDRVERPDGRTEWQTSPGGLVTALEPVMREAGGAWIGWSGDAGPAPGATVWVHDYQLQLVPRMLREQRDDVRIGFFNHIPFPGYEIFAQLPWRRQVVEGLLGADLLGFQRRADATNFLRACRRAVGLTTKGSTVRVREPAGSREIQAAAFPISIDAKGLAEIAQRDDVRKRSAQICEALGEPGLVLLGVDRLDYAKGILHRLRAYGELVAAGRLGPRPVLIQVASPSRERVEAYKTLRDEVEGMVGRINGEYGEG